MRQSANQAETQSVDDESRGNIFHESISGGFMDGMTPELSTGSIFALLSSDFLVLRLAVSGVYDSLRALSPDEAGLNPNEGRTMRLKTLGATLLFLAMASLTQLAKVAGAAEPLANHWLVTADLHGTTIYGRLNVDAQGQKITGEYFEDKFEGSLDGSAIHFVAKDSSGGTSKVDGALKNGVLSGTVVETDAADETHSQRYSFVAIPIRQEHRTASLHHEFAPPCSTASSPHRISPF